MRVGLDRRGVLRLLGGGAAAFGAGGLLAACGSGDDLGVQAGQAPGALKQATPFRIATAPTDNYFIDAVSAEEHIYDKYNLQVPDFIYPSSGVQGSQLLTSGAIDGAVLDTFLALATFSNGSGGKRPMIVGMRVPEMTFSIVVGEGSWPAATASFEERMQALKGKRIGVPAVKSGADLILGLALEQVGMEYDDVAHIGVGLAPPAPIAQLRADRLDAYVAISFVASRLVAEQSGGSVYVDFFDSSVPDLFSNQQINAILVREDYLADHEDVAKVWLKSQWEALEWIVQNRAAASKLLNEQSFSGKAAAACSEYIDHFADQAVPKLNPDFKVSRETIELMIDVGGQMDIQGLGDLTYEKIVPAFARFGEA